MNKVTLGFGLSLLCMLQSFPSLAEESKLPEAGSSVEQPMTLWENLQVGASPATVASVLTSKGVRSKAGEGGGLDVKDKVTIAGVKAKLELAFVSGGLFWVDLKYAVSGGGNRDEFKRLGDALSAKYGVEPIGDASPEIILGRGLIMA